MQELPLMYDPFGLPRTHLPVTVADFDQVLLADERTHVAVIAFRAMPGAVFFQLLIKVRGADGYAPDPAPNLAFAGLEHLLNAGDLRIGVRIQDRVAGRLELPVSGSGGGGDGSFEYQMGFPLAPTTLTATLWARWPGQGFSEGAVELNVDRLREAADRAPAIW